MPNKMTEKRKIDLRPCIRFSDGCWDVWHKGGSIRKSEKHATELDALVYIKTLEPGEFAYYDLDESYIFQTCTPEELAEALVRPPKFFQNQVEAAMEYERVCEAYDRTVCSLRDKNGVARPATGFEQRQVDQHARRVLRELSGRVGLSEKQFLKLLHSLPDKVRYAKT